MRIHSNFIEEADVRKAARLAGVSFTRFSLHGSRKRAQAFDVILSGSSPRRQNSNNDPDYAATWSEWGCFLGYLFGLDAQMDTPYYHGAEHFHWATGGTYRNLDTYVIQRGHCHKWELSGESVTGNYWVHECTKCGEIRRHGDWAAVSAA